MNEVDKKLTTILIAIAAVTTIGTAYAEVLPLPQLPTDYMTEMSVDTKYQSDNRYQIVITVQYQVPSVTQVIDKVTVPNLDGTVTIVPVKDGFVKANTPVVVVDETDPAQEKLDKLLENLQEKKDERDRELTELAKGLGECWYGEDNFHAIQAKASFESPEELIQSIRHYESDVQARILNSAYEECRIMVFYQQWIPTYSNMPPVDEGSQQTRELDESIKRSTPITQDDIDAEAKRATEYQCSDIGKQRGLCVTDFSGVNRGNPNVSQEDLDINPAYKAMITYLAENPQLSKETQEAAAQNVACNIAWDSASKGNISQKWWNDILLDGTCDAYIPELEELR